MHRASNDTGVSSLTLSTWASLELHRAVASAGIDEAGGLYRVGGLTSKVRGATAIPQIAAVAVHEEQVDDWPSSSDPPRTPAVVGATALPALAVTIEQRTARAYGPVVGLPRVLVESDQVGPGDHWSKSFDYRASNFCRFDWLDALVLNALHAQPGPSAERAVPPPGMLCKYARKGYLHILGSAGCGKTSWALDWVRQSRGEAMPSTLPPLAGWYFARRDGENALEHGDEYSALQNLISLARRLLDVLPRSAGTEDRPGTPLRLLSDDERNAHRSKPGPDTEDPLRQRFLLELRWLAQQRPPTAEQPLLFLIDGGDEMWGSGTRYERWSFPRILPDVADLPEHVYIVLLSRPGEHMLGFHGKTPLLRYAFSPADVDRAIRQYLLEQARHWQRLLGPNEASELLRDEQLQSHVCRASEGAFGYVTLLLQQWLPGWQTGSERATIEHHVEQLRRWRQQPGSLPAGLYGLRAREFMGMQGQPSNSPDDPGLAKALALLTQLRWPLSRHELVALLYPGTMPGEDPPGAMALRHRLRQGGSWLAGIDGNAEHEPLRFGHRSLREIALAAWRLQAGREACNEESLAEEARAIAAEHEQADAWVDATRQRTRQEQQRRRADAALHAMLAGASRPERQPVWLAHAKRKAMQPKVGQDTELDTAQAYEWTWGPLHALISGTDGSDNSKPTANGAGQRWRALAEDAKEALIDAGYLQSAIRAQRTYARELGEAPSAAALRDSFIKADDLPGEDPERRLRQRVESALLQWHEHIAERRLHVATMLWNLLGADELGKAHAQRWRGSLDQPAIIASWPGHPSDLDRMILAKTSAVTPCGRWLVTSDGHSKTEIWDLRQGWQRAIVRWRLDWVCGSELQANAQGDEIAIGGVDPGDMYTVVLGVVDAETGYCVLARYAGHWGAVSSVSLQGHQDSQRTVWALASGSYDNTVGLLLRTREQVEVDAQRSGTDRDNPNSGVLARYAGHRGSVQSVSLQGHQDGRQTVWALASGSRDNTVGLLLRTTEQIEDDARRSGTDDAAPNAGLLARYAGHIYWGVDSVGLHCHHHGQQTVWALASGSSDNTVGLLLRTREQVEDDAPRSGTDQEAPNPGVLARYAGHRGSVSSVSLQGNFDGRKIVWAVASGSSDHTVGLLLRTREQVEDDARRSGTDQEGPNPGLLARYAGHRGSVSSVSLQGHYDGWKIVWAVASGSLDYTVGLLLRTSEQIEDDAQRPGTDQGSRNAGSLARYGGHRDRVRSVRLQRRKDGRQTVWALASESRDDSVGLLLRTRKQVEDDAQRGNTDQWNPSPGVLARYAGHRDFVRSVSLYGHYDGRQTVWGLASGSQDRTAGLLLRTRDQVVDDARRLGADQDARNAVVLARYARSPDYCFCVYSVSLHSQHDGRQTVWGLASGWEDGTVGLLLRTSEQVDADARRSDTDNPTPNAGLLARYSGHRSWVGSVCLQGHYDGRQMVWALASGSTDHTVGLVVRTSEQIEDDARRPVTDVRAMNAGVVARYAGHRDDVLSVSLQGLHDAQQTLWAIASGSRDSAVGLMLRTQGQAEEDARCSGFRQVTPNADVLARYGGHSSGVQSISLQGHSQGRQTVWVVASASVDGTTGLTAVASSGASLAHRPGTVDDEARGPRDVRPSGLTHGVMLRQAEPPRQHFPAVGRDAAALWIGGNDEAFVLWSAASGESHGSASAHAGRALIGQAGLVPRLVCPLGAAGLQAMDFAASPDGKTYAVGGAVGNDVAMLMLEMWLPEA